MTILSGLLANTTRTKSSGNGSTIQEKHRLSLLVLYGPIYLFKISSQILKENVWSSIIQITFSTRVNITFTPAFARVPEISLCVRAICFNKSPLAGWPILSNKCQQEYPIHLLLCICQSSSIFSPCSCLIQEWSTFFTIQCIHEYPEQSFSFFFSSIFLRSSFKRNGGEKDLHVVVGLPRFAGLVRQDIFVTFSFLLVGRGLSFLAHPNVAIQVPLLLECLGAQVASQQLFLRCVIMGMNQFLVLGKRNRASKELLN